jgi:hypothetical protein
MTAASAIAEVTEAAWTYLRSPSPGPNLMGELKDIAKYLPSKALADWRVAMPFLAVHPLSIADRQMTMGGQYGGRRHASVQLAFDLFVAVTEQRPDQGQERTVVLADLVREKLVADHRWADGVLTGALELDGSWIKDPVEVAAEALPVLIWRWTAGGLDEDES